ncbi:MAG: FeoB-associated Cys-rich membrane protein [Clostridia bacterium]|nr:FeoB-associated Cys-rich membrane protein [Clostridia bacterium]
MENVIIIAILVLIVGAAIWYVIRAKKSGKKCIGCPDSGCSSEKCSCCCGCSDEKK